MWERRASVGADFDLLDLLYDTIKERKEEIIKGLIEMCHQTCSQCLDFMSLSELCLFLFWIFHPYNIIL